MAEPTVKIYNFGNRKLDYDKYVKNLNSNLESYILYQRDSGAWDDNRVNEFRTASKRYLDAFQEALTSGSDRFSTNLLGSIVDTNGVFNNIDTDDEEGNQFYYDKKGNKTAMTQDAFNALKDRKRRKYSTFNANREVAEYFRQIGTYMPDYETKAKEKFDFDKHGFHTWWSKQYQPNGGSMLPFLDADPIDETTGKRTVANRATNASKWMKEYLDYLKGQDLDYSDLQAFKTKDAYLAKGEELRKKWADNNWTNEDATLAQNFGIDNNWFDTYFTTKGNPQLSLEEEATQQEQIEAVQLQQAVQQAADAETQWLKSQGDKYEKANYTYRFDPNMKKDNIYKIGGMEDFKKQIGEDRNAYIQQLGNTSIWIPLGNGQYKEVNMRPDANGRLNDEQTKALDQYINTYLQRWYIPRHANIGAASLHKLVWSTLVRTGHAKPLDDNRFYIPNPSGNKDNSMLVLDLTPGHTGIYHTYIGNIPNEWNTMYTDWKNSQNPNYDPYVTGYKQAPQETPKYQYGGILNQQAYDALEAKKEADMESSGKTEEQYAASQRPLHDENGWNFTSSDYARMSSAVGDLVSAGVGMAGGTVASGLIGVGSTAANLYADLADDSVTAGQTALNAAIGLGMDAIGMIPLIGGAGKFVKIARTLGKTAGPIMSAVGAISVYNNGPEIKKSFSKLFSGDYTSMTAQDAQNISQGLQFFLKGAAGTGRVVRRGIRTSKETTEVAIPFRNKETGEVQYRTFEGDDAKALSEASNLETMLNILKKYPDLMATHELAKGTAWLGVKENLKGFPTPNKILDAARTASKPQVKPVRQAVRRTWDADIPEGKYVKSRFFFTDDIPLYTNSSGKQVHSTSKYAQKFDKNKGEYNSELPGERAQKKLTNEAITNDKRIQALKDAEAKHKEALATKQADLDAATAAHKKATEEFDALKHDSGYGDTKAVTSALNTARGYKNSTAYKEADANLAALEAAARSTRTANEANLQIVQQKLDAAKANHQAAKDLALDPKTSDSDKAIAIAEMEKYAKELSDLEEAKVRINNDTKAAETKLKLAQETLNKGSDDTIKRLEELEKKFQGYDSSISGHQKEIDRLNALGEHSSEYLDFQSKQVKDGKITFTDTQGKKLEVDINRAFKIAGLKHGGNIQRVKSFRKGGTSNVSNTGNVTWYNDIFSSDASGLKNYILEAAKGGQESVDAFNNLQGSWRTNFNETGYKPGQAGVLYSQGVWDRQKAWNSANQVNQQIETLATQAGEDGKTRLTRAGKSGDNAEGGFQDGYFGEQEYLRHAGSLESWDGQQDALKALQDQVLEASGGKYKYDLDKDNMYKLLAVDQPEDGKQEEAPEGKPEEKPNPSNTDPNPKPEDDKGGQFQDPGLLKEPAVKKSDVLGLSRYFMSLHHNAEIEPDRNINLADPFVFTRYHRGDTTAMYQGARQAAQIRHAASLPVTSDGAQYMAARADVESKANDYEMLGKLLYNNSLKESAEKVWENNRTNKLNEHDTGMANREAVAKLGSNMVNFRNARRLMDYTSHNNFLQEQEYKAQLAEAEDKEEREAVNDFRINQMIKINADNVLGLSDEEQAVWRKVHLDGATSEDLSAAEQKAFASAYRKSIDYKTQQSLQSKGYDFSGLRDMAQNDKPKGSPTDRLEKVPSHINIGRRGGIIAADNGAKMNARAKIRTAKIRERVKNADRVLKSIDKQLDRVDKMLARIDKKMYGISKAPKQR